MWRILVLLALPGVALADSLVATRTIRAHSILGPDDVTMVAAVIPGALTAPQDALGLEARVSIYAGRPIRQTDLGPAAVIDRNQIVSLVFSTGGLRILTEGRALERGGIGDTIRIMNLASRATVAGQIAADGHVYVGAAE